MAFRSLCILVLSGWAVLFGHSEISFADSSEGVFTSSPKVESSSTLSLDETQEKPKKQKSYRIEGTLDLISGEDNSTRLRESQQNAVRQAVIGLNYEFTENYQAYIQMASQNFNDESDMFVSLAYLRIQEQEYGVELDVGQTFYPVGLLTSNDFYFLAQPFYYTEFYKGKRGLDVGFHLKYSPFESLPLTFEAACFQGQIFRGSDSRREAAERAPCAQVVRVSGQHYDFALQRFEHDLAFFDPVVAEGATFQGVTPEFLSRVKLGLWAEYFRIRVDQEDGPQTLNLGGFAYPYLDLRPVRFGYRYGSTQNRTRIASGREVGTRIFDEVLRFEYRPTSFVSFIYEDHVAFQEGGPDLEDQWAVRMLLDFQL
ncbi:MAG: hypothetical protein AAF202_02660 [Pseudomonadota bacterium]